MPTILLLANGLNVSFRKLAVEGKGILRTRNCICEEGYYDVLFPKIIKALSFLLFLLLPALIAAQCDYDQLFREGKDFQRQRQYKMALYKFNSARRCDPNKGESVDAAIEALLDQVEGEKKAADRERKRAETALIEVKKEQEKNERIINLFYFYDNKIALALKDDEYGFIDKEGNIIIEFQYEKAEAFNESAFTKATQDGEEYILDTIGHEYRLSNDTNNLSREVIALDLSNRKISEIPQVVLENTQLKLLWLSGNQISELPADLKKMKRLQILDLSDTHITTLPDELFSLDSLSMLSLKGNGISELPPKICKLKELRVLDLSPGPYFYKLIPKRARGFSGRTDQFDERDIWGYHKYTGKKKVRRHNYLKGLPNEISQLKMLEWFDLSYNKLSKLPDEIKTLKKLRYLNLTANPLSASEIDNLRAAMPWCKIIF